MIAIIDYGVGNLFSLVSSLKSIGAEAVGIVHRRHRVTVDGYISNRHRCPSLSHSQRKNGRPRAVRFLESN